VNRGLIPDYITGLPIEIFALAIRERKPALGISQKHGHGIWMRMHGRFFTGTVVRFQHSDPIVLESHCVMFRIHLCRVLRPQIHRSARQRDDCYN